jgi:proteasome accessory factor A
VVELAFGIETEYGIMADRAAGDGAPGRGAPRQNPVELSNWVVAAYKASQDGRVAPWDHASEDPLNDARGFRLDRAAAQPSARADQPASPAPAATLLPDAVWSAPPARPGSSRAGSRLADGIGGAIGADVAGQADWPGRRGRDDPVRRGPGAALLRNGARLYVDHAHPEYASPETASAREAALWDLAGQRIMARAGGILAAAGTPVSLYKNNTDGHGASYGTHENYLVDRAVDWELLVGVMTPFLVTRQVFTGSGRVGLGARSQEPGFQISQRADFVEAEVGLETTLNRPIINTRDEPHADPARWRRLHVIVGDATMMEVATYVRLGVTGLVLRALAAAPPARASELAEALRLATPAPAFWQVSRDLTASGGLALRSGGELTAVAAQQRCRDFVTANLRFPDAEAADLIERWSALLDGLRTDPLSLARQVEWVAKYQLLESLRARRGWGWDHPKLRAADLRWTDADPSRSLFARLAARGGVESLFEEREVAWAAAHPPTSTRAYLKGEALSRYPDNVVAAGWDSLTLAWDGGGARLGLLSPLAGRRDQVEALLAEAASARDLVSRLTGVDQV